MANEIRTADDQRSAGWGTHIIENSNDTFSFAGTVPISWAYCYKDDPNRALDEKTIGDLHDASMPSLVAKRDGLGKRVFSSYQDAFSFMKREAKVYRLPSPIWDDRFPRPKQTLSYTQGRER
jgi:hypothetical protein